MSGPERIDAVICILIHMAKSWFPPYQHFGPLHYYLPCMIDVTLQNACRMLHADEIIPHTHRNALFTFAGVEPSYALTPVYIMFDGYHGLAI